MNTMNIDTLSYRNNINRAVEQVRLSDVSGRWILLGYVDKAKKSSIMTINVMEEGMIWCDLLDSFEDDKIQYGYTKLEFGPQGNMRLFLIHWIGNNVGENEKHNCMPHLAVIKDLVVDYDLLINAMDPLDVNAKVDNYFKLNSISQLKDTSGRTNQKKASTALEEQVTKKLPKVKVIIVGNSGVGKSCIYRSYDRGGINMFGHEVPGITINLDFMRKKVKYGQYEFELQMWDTVGQERFHAYMPTWLRDAQVVICTYEITDYQSYTGIPKILELAKQYVDSKAILFLVGNKADLIDCRRVQQAKAKAFATENGMNFLECSGMTGLNIMNLFDSITQQVVQVYQDFLTSSLPTESFKLVKTNSFYQQDGTKAEDNQSKCCWN